MKEFQRFKNVIHRIIENVYNQGYENGLGKAQKVLNALQDMEQEPCDDAISRQAVLNLLEDTNNGWIINEVSQLPSVTQKSNLELICEELAAENDKLIEQLKQKQKLGKWDRSCTCSVCGKWRILESEKNGGKYKYCPNCGARMVEPQESEDEE